MPNAKTVPEPVVHLVLTDVVVPSASEAVTAQVSAVFVFTPVAGEMTMALMTGARFSDAYGRIRLVGISLGICGCNDTANLIPGLNKRGCEREGVCRG